MRCGVATRRIFQMSPQMKMLMHTSSTGEISATSEYPWYVHFRQCWFLFCSQARYLFCSLSLSLFRSVLHTEITSTGRQTLTTHGTVLAEGMLMTSVSVDGASRLLAGEPLDRDLQLCGQLFLDPLFLQGPSCVLHFSCGHSAQSGTPCRSKVVVQWLSGFLILALGTCVLLFPDARLLHLLPHIHQHNILFFLHSAVFVCNVSSANFDGWTSYAASAVLRRFLVRF